MENSSSINKRDSTVPVYVVTTLGSAVAIFALLAYKTNLHLGTSAMSAAVGGIGTGVVVTLIWNACHKPSENDEDDLFSPPSSALSPAELAEKEEKAIKGQDAFQRAAKLRRAGESPKVNPKESDQKRAERKATKARDAYKEASRKRHQIAE